MAEEELQWAAALEELRDRVVATAQGSDSKVAQYRMAVLSTETIVSEASARSEREQNLEDEGRVHLLPESHRWRHDDWWWELSEATEPNSVFLAQPEGSYSQSRDRPPPPPQSALPF